MGRLTYLAQQARTCNTGLVFQVPEYLEVGEAIIVDTATGEFVSRANVSKF
jgi:hypothetical protein